VVLLLQQIVYKKITIFLHGSKLTIGIVACSISYQITGTAGNILNSVNREKPFFTDNRGK